MIFAAGLGTRFKPWTDSHPKALAVVNGKSLLQRNVEYLRSFGIQKIIVNVHHFPQQILEAIDASGGWGADIAVSDESGQLLETGGGLLHAKDLFTAGERLLTCNVDILTDLDLDRLIRFHEEQKPMITLAVTGRTTSRNFLFDETGRLCGWQNDVTGKVKMPVHVNSPVSKAYSGVALFEPSIFEMIRQRGKFSLVDVYLDLAAGHRVIGFDHTGAKFVDVGKPESVVIAESLFP